tara:strand:- start:1822 stop:2265 length:444 start_codon:yes stop_codon:yes gene_type:complete
MKLKKSSQTPVTEISERKWYIPESPIAPYRSKFEQSVAENLERRGCNFEYESIKVEYILNCKYTPDFILPNGIIVEIKGRLTKADARKHRAIKKQHPELDIRFVFMNTSTRVDGSKYTHKQWCKRYKFLFAERIIPKSWTDVKKKND